MIEIKQDWDCIRLTSKIGAKPTRLYHAPILKSDLPHLISRLIELGGEEVTAEDVWMEMHPPDINAYMKHLDLNYHLIPKADKK